VAVALFANQLWKTGAIPRTWLERWDVVLPAAAAAWAGTSEADRDLWAAYGRLVDGWEAWHTEVETLAVPERGRPYPQYYGATALWAAAVGAPPPGAAPLVSQFPLNDIVVLSTYSAPPPPPWPLAAHVYATWVAPGGWGGRVVYLVVFARSTVPLQPSNKYWRTRGIGGLISVSPGVPVCLDPLLALCQTSGANAESWIRVALVEPGLVPFFVGEQERGIWFTS